jgi:DNA-binding GntR family transcriptional regulator
MKRQSITRSRPLGQEVTLMLRRMIVHGELKPNERLVEERLAAQLGISRTPLREALHRLEQKRLLSKRDRGGYVVRPLSYQEVEEAVDVRAFLDVLRSRARRQTAYARATVKAPGQCRPVREGFCGAR